MTFFILYFVSCLWPGKIPRDNTYGLSKEYYAATGASREKRIKFHSIEEKMPKGDSTILIIIRPLFFVPVLFEALIKSRYGIVHFQDRLPLLFLFLPFLKLKGKQICWELHDVDILSIIILLLIGKLRELSLTKTQCPMAIM